MMFIYCLWLMPIARVWTEYVDNTFFVKIKRQQFFFFFFVLKCGLYQTSEVLPYIVSR